VETTLFHRIRADSVAFSARGRRTGFRPPKPSVVAAAAEVGGFCCRGRTLVRPWKTPFSTVSVQIPWRFRPAGVGRFSSPGAFPPCRGSTNGEFLLPQRRIGSDPCLPKMYPGYVGRGNHPFHVIRAVSVPFRPWEPPFSTWSLANPWRLRPSGRYGHPTFFGRITEILNLAGCGRSKFLGCRYWTPEPFHWC
jgi:hypothetical protein